MIRWGILGCGDIVRKRVAAAIVADRNSQLVAACRRDADALQIFCADFDVPHAFSNAHDLIHSSHVDAVYVATPVHLHCPNTIEAARQGKHVLVEKPMGMNAQQCEQMIAVCHQNKVKLGVAYYRRFYPVIERIRGIIDNGQLGKIMSVHVTTGNGFRQKPGNPGYWRAISEEGGGGAIMDIGSHRIDLLLDLFGQIDRVKAECSTIAGDYRVEDSASILFRFHSGVLGVLQCFFGTANVPDRITIFGNDGYLTCDPLNDGKLTISTGESSLTEHHPPAANLHQPLIEDFSKSILEDRDPMVSGRDGLATNLILDSAYQNA